TVHGPGVRGLTTPGAPDERPMVLRRSTLRAMVVKAATLESDVIEAVIARVRERLPADQAVGCEAFVRQYYGGVPPEDLAGRNPLDLYGAAVQHWNEMLRRAPGEMTVEVYNPTFEHHGWQSPHTVVEIVTD